MTDYVHIIDSVFKLLGIVGIPALVYLGQRLNHQFKMAELASKQAAKEVKEVKADLVETNQQAKVANQEHKEQIAEALRVLAGHGRLLELAKDRDDGKVRILLESNARLTATLADMLKTPEARADADHARKRLVDHDKAQESVDRMTGSELVEYMSPEGADDAPAAAQKIADLAVDQAAAVKAYDEARRPESIP